MTGIYAQDRPATLSIGARLFAEKAARSVAEVQDGINSVADVATFLEILGYDDNQAVENGFTSLHGLSGYVFDFIDSYDDQKSKYNNTESSQGNKLPIIDLKSRLIEAVGLQAPWMGAIIVLNLTGVSLWMAKGLPRDIATVFIAGVFSGLILSEGLLQMFSRLIFMHHDQGNGGEVRRLIIRSYLSTSAVVGLIALIGLVVFSIARVPPAYFFLFLAAAAGVAVHRMSFNLLYTLKMVKSVLGAYACGFAVLLAVYYLFAPSLTTGLPMRYFVSLGAAFGVLSGISLYYHLIVIRSSGRSRVDSRAADSINFYKPQGTVRNSLKSRFRVQAFESIPYFVSGLFFFVMLFGDRILAWIFNPDKLVIASNEFPFAFNSEYHAGADLALLALVPMAIVQYVVISPLYAMIQNKASDTRLRDLEQLASLVESEYKKSLLVVFAVVGVSVILLNSVGQNMITLLRGTSTSLDVMHIASIANLALSVLTTNLLYLAYLNRLRLASKFVVLAAVLTIGLGACFAQYGVANIAYGYLISAVVVASTSTIVTRKTIRNEMVRALARFS